MEWKLCINELPKDGERVLLYYMNDNGCRTVDMSEYVDYSFNVVAKDEFSDLYEDTAHMPLAWVRVELYDGIKPDIIVNQGIRKELKGDV